MWSGFTRALQGNLEILIVNFCPMLPIGGGEVGVMLKLCPGVNLGLLVKTKLS